MNKRVYADVMMQERNCVVVMMDGMTDMKNKGTAMRMGKWAKEERKKEKK